MQRRALVKLFLMAALSSLSVLSCTDSEVAGTKADESDAEPPKLFCFKEAKKEYGTYTALFYGGLVDGKETFFYGRGRCSAAGEADGTRTLDQFTTSQVAYVDTAESADFKPSEDNKYFFQLTGSDLFLVKVAERIAIGKVIKKREWAKIKLNSNIELTNLLIKKGEDIRPYNSQTDAKAKFDQRYIHITVKR